MPTTRKKVIRTVYKDEDDSEEDKYAGDFSDSGSEAEIPEHSSSDDEIDADTSSADEFDEKFKRNNLQRKSTTQFTQKLKKTNIKFAKLFVNKIHRPSTASADDEVATAPPLISVKDLTAEDKLLPSVLNLSESDSSEDESPRAPVKKQPVASTSSTQRLSDSESEEQVEYKDVWTQNTDSSEEIAKKTFMELEQHKTKIEETKASVMNYEASRKQAGGEFDVKDLLAQGEEVSPQSAPVKKGRKGKKVKEDSDSEMDDWEEVKEARSIPQQGIQLVVDFPDAACRKKKTIDVEMMMKRKINRVKKEYQVYMHKVHVLCWLGHGNYVSKVLNNQEVLAAALSLVPKGCYPGQRVDVKYIEQITTWYKDKFTLKQDKHEDKFRPKAPPLKDILLAQIKSRTVTAKKYLVFIFVSMLRAIGLQCRVMFNFVTLPIKPPSSELCSLSTKPKESKSNDKVKKEEDKSINKPKASKGKAKGKIPQLDGQYDSSFCSDSDMDSLMQLDGNDDTVKAKTRSVRSTKANKNADKPADGEDVSPPKRARRSPTPRTAKTAAKSSESNSQGNKNEPQKRKRATKSNQEKPDASKDTEKKTTRTSQIKRNSADRQVVSEEMEVDQVPKAPKRTRATKTTVEKSVDKTTEKSATSKISRKGSSRSSQRIQNEVDKQKELEKTEAHQDLQPTKKSRTSLKPANANKTSTSKTDTALQPPDIIVTNENNVLSNVSKYFNDDKKSTNKSLSLRKQSQTPQPPQTSDVKDGVTKPKARTKSAPGNSVETSKYFNGVDEKSPLKTEKSPLKTTKVDTKSLIKSTKISKKEIALEDAQRVSHKDLLAKTKPKPKNDVTGDLVDIMKKRIREAKEDSKKGKVKAKINLVSDDDSDHLPEEQPKRKSASDDDFKPTKISPKARPSTSKKIDRRVLSSDNEEVSKNKCDVWAEVYVEDIEQWICIDVIKAKVHCPNEIYSRATHPVCYVVGWDNNNFLKDVTRRYVPHWNTVTRKARAEAPWFETAVAPYTGPRTARQCEEDDQLARMQLDAPLPKSIAEYKHHPLYALKRHLLKFEAIYPPDAAALGFVRGEPVYARECVHVCRSRDTWLKEAKVVRLGEQPYKVVKARPKWDRLSNKLITDKPLEVFGPWQVQDYEPPTAENGVVPRNAYGNVELFKACMLPKGTAHIKLPGLNRVAKKLNIDCAPAMTGFDFNGGWSHPVYDGFVVCEEFQEIVTDAWLKDQEDQERREREKIETRVYGNWKRLIKGLFIRERLKNKYGFDDPPAPANEKKKKGPRLVLKKNT